MSDAMSDALNPVRFVPVEPTYPRKRLLSEVPVGHMVHCENDERFVVTNKGKDFAPLFCSSGVRRPWPTDHVVTDHGPVAERGAK